MSEHSPEADRGDERAYGAGGGSSIDADVASSGAEADNTGAETYDSSGTDSHASDVAAGYDDADDSPVQHTSEEDGSF